MIRKQKDGIEWLEFELLADIPALAHGIFLRHGGVSDGPYRSLHAGKNEESDSEAIGENRSRIKKILKLDHLISAYEVHGTSIVHVSGPSKEIPNCDGMITREANLGLMIKHADCQATIFYDPEHQAIANVHCGWRGNVQNIYRETVLEMRKTFLPSPENILSRRFLQALGPKNRNLSTIERNFQKSFLPYEVKPTYFDLWAISQDAARGSEGILSHHIEIASICTYSHPEDYFSFRRDNRVTGNHATVAVLL